MRKGLLTAALLALLIAAPAQADSIVFNKDGDLWLAYPDGSQRTLLASDKCRSRCAPSAGRPTDCRPRRRRR
jgi:hypothetical protein